MRCVSLKTGFSRFFPCSVWGGREPTAALAEKARDEISAFRLVLYSIRRALAHTEQAIFNGFYQIACIFCISCLSANMGGRSAERPYSFQVVYGRCLNCEL